MVDSPEFSPGMPGSSHWDTNRTKVLAPFEENTNPFFSPTSRTWTFTSAFDLFSP